MTRQIASLLGALALAACGDNPRNTYWTPDAFPIPVEIHDSAWDVGVQAIEEWEARTGRDLFQEPQRRSERVTIVDLAHTGTIHITDRAIAASDVWGRTALMITPTRRLLSAVAFVDLQDAGEHGVHITMHEIGHALGLRHHPSPEYVMHANVGRDRRVDDREIEWIDAQLSGTAGDLEMPDTSDSTVIEVE